VDKTTYVFLTQS